MEIKTEVKVKNYLVEMVCSSCEVGKMVATGEAYMTLPPKHFHSCDKCLAFETFLKNYPYIEQEYV